MTNASRKSTGLPVVKVIYPLLAWAVAGVWLSWPWFIFNAFAVGTDRRRPMFRILATGLTGSSALALLIFALAPESAFFIAPIWEMSGHGSDVSIIPYLLIVLYGWKFSISLALSTQQARELDVYEYFGGSTRNGAFILVAGFFLRSWVLLTLLPVGWWTLVLS